MKIEENSRNFEFSFLNESFKSWISSKFFRDENKFKKIELNNINKSDILIVIFDGKEGSNNKLLFLKDENGVKLGQAINRDNNLIGVMFFSYNLKFAENIIKVINGIDALNRFKISSITEKYKKLEHKQNQDNKINDLGFSGYFKGIYKKAESKVKSFWITSDRDYLKSILKDEKIEKSDLEKLLIDILSNYKNLKNYYNGLKQFSGSIELNKNIQFISNSLKSYFDKNKSLKVKESYFDKNSSLNLFENFHKSYIENLELELNNYEFVLDGENLENIEHKEIENKKKKIIINEQPVKKESKKFILDDDLGFKNLVHSPEFARKELELVKEKFLQTYKSDKNNGYYAAKRIIPAASAVAVHADFHGDKYAMLELIKDLAKRGYTDKDNPFKIIKKDFYIVFLGDFVDRGPDGLEVLYLAMRLRVENPDQVELIRGNHENIIMNLRKDIFGGFFMEVEKKLGLTGLDFIRIINPIYNAMPSVLFLGVKSNNFVNYMMFVHGGIEPRFDPNNLLGSTSDVLSEKINELGVAWLGGEEKFIESVIGKKEGQAGLQAEVSSELIENGVIPGFLFNDFILDKNTFAKSSARGGSSAEFGKDFTRQYLDLCSKKEKYQVSAIIRGHQHSGIMMKLLLNHAGAYGLWLNDKEQFDCLTGKTIKIPQYSVWTLLVSPILAKNTNFSYGNILKYNYDIYSLLRFEENSNLWVMDIVKILPDLKK